MNVYISCCHFFLCFLYFSSPLLGQKPGNEIIDYSTIIKIEKGKQIIERSFLIQINHKQFDWISDIEIPYHKNDKVEILEAVILDEQSNVLRKLKKKEIITRNDISSSSFYDDNFVKEFKLKWNSYPYQIRYRYRQTRNEFIYVANWYPLVENAATRNASLKVVLPTDYNVKMEVSDDLTYSKNKENSTITHHWKLESIKPIKEEVLSPPLQELIPHVTIVSQQFEYGEKGDATTWKSYGDWQNLLNKGTNTLTLSEQIKVKKLVDGIKDPKEKIRTLYHYLQDNTRYINVAIDIGGLKPYPASYVCDKKYGDCKALTVYMKALLEEVGIESHYTTVYAGENPVRINPDLPSQQFNHVILSVPLENDTIWLENTSNYLPFNYLGTFTQNRYALQVDSDASQLVKTPSLESNDVLEENRYYFTLNKYKESTASITKFIQGKQFEEAQYARFNLKEKEQKDFIETLLTINNYEIQDWKYEQKNRDQAQLKLDINLSLQNQLKKVGEILTFKPIQLKIPTFEAPEKRKSGVQINYPINISDYIVYTLPFMKDYMPTLPPKEEIKTTYGKYIVEYRYNKNDFQIEVLKYFQLYRNDYSVEEYPDFYEFMETITDKEQQTSILLKPM